MNTLRSPQNAEEFAQYYQLRWQILRKPWQQVLGSEQDEHEPHSIHRMIIDETGHVLAVGRLEQSAEQQGQIRYMAVCETAQGQGLGQQIIAELERIASKLGITEIVLNAREKALGFYQQLDYQQHEISHVLFGEVTHYRMTKTLKPHHQHKHAKALALQSVWHETIPMSKAMGLKISYYDAQQLITYCDPKFNKNLHNTMFAGSIYTLATLTGWGWVYLALGEYQQGLQGDIVLAEANIRYHTPIKGLVYGQVVESDVSGKFDNLARGKNARLKLTAHIYCGETIAATFTGSYVVLPKKGTQDSE
ncbi:MAG: bifunctional GNAT family N-acetyltransferase/hotdog fold thioesterase [Colwellia sp.]|nr:bifunctional GNAT family N-acetyltransferase/hotdog fold thioesterase [Colwellia sp.]MCW8865110.1 bifunctional GNAT family N-acetyltransferase/hotdog fold thioesterase [Colwellia sp.]MCW9082922.1 bifunctional GNAT family N-acetyltransferase/hotdog fold thioesterase [Colwellia sp.]